MKILFDQGTPVPLRHSLSGHTIVTAYEIGWSTLKNGDLIRSAEADDFEIFVTTDTNLKYQQTLQRQNNRDCCFAFHQLASHSNPSEGNCVVD